MDSLRIENLSPVLQAEDGGMSRPIADSARRQEDLVRREMERNGMQASPDPGLAAAGSASLPAPGSFAGILRDSISKVNEYQLQADQAVKEMVAGRNKNIHETLLTVERADTSLKLMMQVRNKILDAYREVMRMQI